MKVGTYLFSTAAIASSSELASSDSSSSSVSTSLLKMTTTNDIRNVGYNTRRSIFKANHESGSTNSTSLVSAAPIWYNMYANDVHKGLSWNPFGGGVDCTRLKSCESCYNASYWCHWCGEDKTGNCATKGTGCVYGSTCGGDSVNATCAAASDCLSCTAASSMCHWCGDSCHALGSIYGCAVGVNCMANSECLRKEPEYIGITWAPRTVYMVGAIMVAFIWAVGGCMQCVCYRVYKQVNEARMEIERAYETAEAVDARPALWARVTDKLVGGCFRNSCYFFVFLVMPTTLILYAGTILNWPREPVIDYCSKEVEWANLFKNIDTVVTEQVYLDFEFLVSIYNPNRVAAHIEEVQGRLYYPPESSQQIGTVQMHNFTAAAGSVSDALAIVSLSLERWSALNLAQLYYRGKLQIGAKADVTFGLDFYGIRISHQTISQEQVVDTALPLDMQYCNCKDGPPKRKVANPFKTSLRNSFPSKMHLSLENVEKTTEEKTENTVKETKVTSIASHSDESAERNGEQSSQSEIFV